MPGKYSFWTQSIAEGTMLPLDLAEMVSEYASSEVNDNIKLQIKKLHSRLQNIIDNKNASQSGTEYKSINHDEGQETNVEKSEDQQIKEMGDEVFRIMNMSSNHARYIYEHEIYKLLARDDISSKLSKEAAILIKYDIKTQSYWLKLDLKEKAEIAKFIDPETQKATLETIESQMVAKVKYNAELAPVYIEAFSQFFSSLSDSTKTSLNKLLIAPTQEVTTNVLSGETSGDCQRHPCQYNLEW